LFAAVRVLHPPHWRKSQLITSLPEEVVGMGLGKRGKKYQKWTQPSWLPNEGSGRDKANFRGGARFRQTDDGSPARYTQMAFWGRSRIKSVLPVKTMIGVFSRNSWMRIEMG